MIIENLLNEIAQIIGVLAVIAIVVTAFGLMLGFLKPADAFTRIAVIVGTVIALLVLPQIVVSTWLAIPLWQQLALMAIALVILLAFASRRGTGSRHRE